MHLKLQTVTLRDWPFTQMGIAFGEGRLPLEVLYSKHNRTPSRTALQRAWQARQGRRGVPLMVVVLHAEKAHVCGPAGDPPLVYLNLDAGQVERVCKEALEQPSRQDALRSLRDSLVSLEKDGLPGLRNEGFLASHELAAGVPNRSDWPEARDKARSSLGLTGTDLLFSLGFTVDPLDNVTEVLRAGDLKTAVAVLLTDRETPEAGSERIPGNVSPVSYAMQRAKEESLDWVVLLHGHKIRLYPVKTDIGVGRRGLTETFLECHTGLIADDQAAYLWLLFSAEALTESGSLLSILADSKDYAGDLASRLRERIYVEVIPRLAEGLARARGLRNPTAQDLSETYQMAMWMLFRILFVAYGEDKDLLPYHTNSHYRKRSLKTKAKELLELTHSEEGFGEGDTWWVEVKAIFRAVDKGHEQWGVPVYNGGLFSSDTEESPIGAKLEEVSLPDTVFGPVLENLLLVPTNEGVLGPVDFRSLGVREFGTIYEGLLESELSVADTDLTVEATGKTAGRYRPCKDGEEPVVAEGEVYLHNASGARKSSGSYYTKHFAVEHLLDCALEPALNDHFERLDQLDELEAAESFFDFRVADIAMGSGHFLVAAVDRIETRFSSYLATRDLPFVSKELDHLRKEAASALGDNVDPYLEDNALLRRLIARRCIYGVDINAVAVQLARLGIWIHTFVPGLPLSFLDRNLIHGNSLVGVGDLSELVEKVQEEMPLFEATAADFVGDASDALARLGRLTDASLVELKEARKAWKDTDKATAPAKALCDILTAARIEDESLPFDFSRWQEKKGSVVGGEDHKHALAVLDGLNVFHFPVTFPEVFLRERAGFDVILGNPPWEKVRLEEDIFGGRYRPGGLRRTLSQREQELVIEEFRNQRPDLVQKLKVEVATVRAFRKVLSGGQFPGMGTGDPDLYKAFCWRFWSLVVERSGRIGVVLPRAVLTAKGSEQWRWEVLKKAKDIRATIILNSRKWFFEDVHPQFTIALVDLERRERTSGASTVYLEGPYSSQSAYDTRVDNSGASFTGTEVFSWNDSASFPLLPLPSSKYGAVFAQLRSAPRLDLDEAGQWRARPLAEVHATNDKYMYDLTSEDCPSGFWPVYKGASFNLWEPDTGEYYAWADPNVVTPVLQKKRLRGNRSAKSVFHECDASWCASPDTLPCHFSRIAFRDVTQKTNRRTVICALVPPRVFLNHKAPYFVFPRGTKKDEAFFLGILSSIPLDWYARRFVEVSMTFFILNPFPIPRPDSNHPLRTRVIELAGRLACPDERFADWAKEVGVECGPLPDDEKQDMIHELDAVVAHLYGLTSDHLIHVFETFHVGWDYDARLEETLKHYQNWKARA